MAEPPAKAPRLHEPPKQGGTPKFKSTRGGQSNLGFEDAVFEGLARDGGLLVPDWVPDVSAVYKGWASMTFDEIAFEIVSRFCPESEIPAVDLRTLLKQSYKSFEHSEVVPLVKVGDFYVMELFHGPTFSFKDVALQSLGNLYEYFLKRRSRRLTIISATSGDTGSAAIYGLAGKENVDCFVLFPEGRVSAIQQAQMTSVLEPNVHNISVKGTFDDCQNIVKELFGDLDLKQKFGLGAVNSINWARIMFQITYYFYTYFKLFPQCDGTMSFSVPTGNFGDILAGYYAKRMGLPVMNLVVATNSNDILYRFFTKGEYDKGAVYQTTSPSMDIQISSNFERYLYYLFDEDTEKLAEAMDRFKRSGRLHVSADLKERALADFVSGRSSDELVSETIATCFKTHGYTVCPHTACGVAAVEQLQDRMSWRTLEKHEVVVLGTAHPAKFHDVVDKIIGKPVDMPPALAHARMAKTRFATVGNSRRLVQNSLERSLYNRGNYLTWQDRETGPRAESLPGEPGMWLVCLDVEGTLTPEAWLALQQKTGIEGLKKTTAHEPDYDKLMMYRIDLLRQHGIKLQDMKDVVQDLEPLPGCKEFLKWLKSVVPRILLLTDTFEEYAMPMFEKLGYPSVFCHSVTVDKDDFITGHKLRLRDQKRKTVESFQRLNYRVISVGDSFNDISMMKAAERGILMYPAEKVLNAHGSEFPVCQSYEELKMQILKIVMEPPAVLPRPLAVPLPSDRERERSMWLVLVNVAGTLAPEPWPVLQAVTGLDELITTTADVPDYNALMAKRMQVLRNNGIKLQKLFDVVQVIDPMHSAREFLEWLKPIVPRSFMISDTFEEYTLSVTEKLGHPMVFCNFLVADFDGYLCEHVVRVHGQKRLAVEEFQQLNFRVIAIGHSFNDIPMLKVAEEGILFKPSEHLTQAHPEIAAVQSFDDLKQKILGIVRGDESA